jgi:thioredoxin reductase
MTRNEVSGKDVIKLLEAQSDFEKIKFPLTVQECSEAEHGTTVTLRDLNRRLTYRDLECDEEIEMETNWLFVCIGGRPRTEWTDADMLTRDSAGYILTGSDLLIRAKSIKRCATAVGEGAAAVSFVHQFLAHEASVL